MNFACKVFSVWLCFKFACWPNRLSDTFEVPYYRTIVILTSLHTILFCLESVTSPTTAMTSHLSGLFCRPCGLIVTSPPPQTYRQVCTMCMNRQMAVCTAWRGAIMCQWRPSTITIRSCSSVWTKDSAQMFLRNRRVICRICTITVRTISDNIID